MSSALGMENSHGLMVACMKASGAMANSMEVDPISMLMDGLGLGTGPMAKR